MVTFKKVYYLSVSLLDNGEQLFNLSIYDANQKCLVKSILSNAKEFSAKKLLKRSYPLIIGLSSDQVITKQISTNQNLDVSLVRQQILPGTTSDDFDVQFIDEKDSDSYGAVVRTELVDKVYDMIPSTTVVVGFFIENLLNKYSEPESDLSNLEYYLNSIEYINSSFNNTLEFNTQNYRWQRIFNSVKILGLLTLLLSVVANSYIADNINESINDIQESQNKKLELQSYKSDLQNRLANKKSFLASSGIHNRIPFSYYMNELALSVPSKIFLNELKVNPVVGNINPKKDIEYAFNNISIFGTCNDPLDIDDWVNIMNEYKWVQKVVIKDMSENDRSKEIDFQINVTVSGSVE